MTAMFDRFTDRARRVMGLARQEAERLHHPYVGTEHLLLGLVEEGSGVAASVLKSLDVDLDDARAEIERRMPKGPDATPSGDLPFTDRAQLALEFGLEEAGRLGHAYVGTEHLLLGLLREDEGVAAQVLRGLGAEIGQVRGEVREVVGSGTSATEASGAARAGSPAATPTPADLDREIAAVQSEKAAAVAAEDFVRAAALRDREVELRARKDRLGAGSAEGEVLRDAARVAQGAADVLRSAARELEALGRDASAAVAPAAAEAQALEALARILQRHPRALDRLLGALGVSRESFLATLLHEVRRRIDETPGAPPPEPPPAYP